MAFEQGSESLILATNEKELLFQMRQYFKDLKVSEYDLKTPTSNFVIEFYKVFLSEFYIDANAIMQIQMCQATMLAENSDMYHEIIPLINLTNAVKSFKIPALKNFCIYDLITPAPKRTFNHLANVMLFINFADSRVAVLEPKLNNVKVLEEKKQMIFKNIDEMKQMYNARVIEIENKKSSVKDKEAEIERLTAEIRKMEHLKEVSSSKWNKVKAEFEEISSKYEEAVKQSIMLKNDIKELNSHIKQLKGGCSDMMDSGSEMLSSEILEEKVKQTSERVEYMRESLILKQTYMEDLAKDQSKLSSIVHVLKEVSKQIELAVELELKQTELQKRLNKIEEGVEKIKSSNLSAEQELLKKSEDLTGLRLQWSRQKSSLTESLEFAKSKFEDRQRNNIVSNEIIEEIESYEQTIIINESAYEALLDEIEREITKRDEEIVQVIYKTMQFDDDDDETNL